ncbi:DNA primase family protein [Mesorhizobium sp. M00.F.Ca.ET.216.01.1.1]|uniref:DNA primase family protein n=1 Tax=Mesorhizobium sp. M00.F.Ca.ET.216.01.1.1 TaxID=2500528 RepID=UPI000FD77423|nr:DNA primase family protein [Mesorhizobium sp. M00.F.Ca.ET.216.01.1.1]TGQ31905.1 hypothetical protein EN859_029750 [Mesorhizobium sp. M00.F.Ca.ET.216.01.1.1]
MNALAPLAPAGNPAALSITYFQQNNQPAGQRRDVEWPALCDWIVQDATTATTKDDLPLIKLATFAGDYRSDINLEAVFGIEGDYDGGLLQPSEAARILTAFGVQAFIYTSPSHRPDTPRWRVLCPLSRPHTPNDRHAIVGRLNGLLGGILAPESFVPSQAFYVGSVAGGYPVQFWRVEGRPLDAFEGLPIVAPPPSAKMNGYIPIGQGERAPSFDAAVAGLQQIDVRQLTERGDWTAVSGAFMQSIAPERINEALPIWQAWNETYPDNDPAKNLKYWDDTLKRGTIVKGWRRLHREAYGEPPQLNPMALFNGATYQLPPGASATPLQPQQPAPLRSRNIEEVLNDAAKLTPDNADAITALCREAGTLPPIHRDTVLNAIRTTTGIRIATLRAEASQATNDTEPDHLVLARMTLATAGAENVIHAENHFWIWEGGGVWNKRDDIAIKKQVQTTLEANNCAVTAARVSGVTDVLRNETYRPDHTFNIGNSDVVNCRNGELELGDIGWTLQPHRREHYRTSQIPVAYDPSATAPMFLAFLNDVFRDDPDRDLKICSLLELIGYTLMSHAKHERFIMLIGGGANGKSVLLSVIEALVGMKNVAGVQPANFQSRFQRAHLHQKLANIVTELKQGEIIADAELKAITSGELTTVEDKNGHPFEMRAFATCWFGTNHLPHTRDFSDALFRRATIVTFDRTFSEAEQDHNLKTKLATELPGILNLAITSYARATTHGFIAPPSSIEAKRKWRMEADQVAQFVEEQCLADPLGMVAVDEVYRVFAEWARRSGVRQIVGKQMMGDRLEKLRFPRKRSNGSWITGLTLRTAANYGSPP